MASVARPEQPRRWLPVTSTTEVPSVRMSSPPTAPAQKAEPLRRAVERAKVETIRATLAATNGRRNEAAEILGISRKTLWEKIKSYGITVDS